MKCIASTFFFCAMAAVAVAQKGPGEVVADFQLKKVINAAYTTAAFNTIRKDLTIIDFFGTWCTPCIRALPHLAAVQEKYKDRLRIILVSSEEEEKLEKFVAGRNHFPFPLVVDTDQSISSLFRPPSYPYSVVLDRNGKVLATITDAARLTDAAIGTWLATPPAEGKAVPVDNTKKTLPVTPLQKSSNAAVELSQAFLYAVKTGDPTGGFERKLALMEYSVLTQTLKTDKEKTAFWINIYNGYTNAILKQSPEKYKNRHQFFSADALTVAGRRFSLDDIEHGILRRSRTKWSLGYVGKLFPSQVEKELRVEKADYRVHFALNCGARSCPPIAFYSPERLDQQLEAATKNYLLGEATYDKSKNHVRLPAIMGWFRADFGGKKGMRSLLKQHDIIEQEGEPTISFKPYNWDLYLDNYREG